MIDDRRHLTREEAIRDLRGVLERLQDDERSVCRVAAERKLFCRGFAQWKFGELRARYPQIVRSRPRITRKELEDLADRWQLARQRVTGLPVACDVQREERVHAQCRGWDEFDDAELEAFHAELCGERVVIERPA
jgi:hypothetical protein